MRTDLLAKKCIFYNAIQTCSRQEDIYIYTYAMGDEFYSLTILFLISIVLFSFARLVQLIQWYSLYIWYQKERRKSTVMNIFISSNRTWNVKSRNCDSCRIPPNWLLISKKDIVYVYNKILSWAKKTT